MKRWLMILAGLCLIWVQPSPADTGDEPYRLGSDDVLQIQVWGREELSGQVAVGPNGRIQLPLVGEIDVHGQTPQELRSYLLERYQLMDSDVTEVLVSVAQYNSRTITVVGEVHAPGRQAFRTLPDLWAALLAAGGTKPTADLEQVQVVRHDPLDGESRTVTVDLTDGIEDTPTEILPALRPKDTVVVPSLAEEAIITDDMIQILGAVRSPGAYRLEAAGRVVKAVSISGGHLPNADLRHVRLTRPTQQGPFTYQLDLQGYLYEARPVTDLELQAGDIITVPSKRSTWASILDGFLRVAPLISVAVSARYFFD